MTMRLSLRRQMMWAALPVTALALGGMAAGVASAQANRGSTASGAFGQTTLGSTSGVRPQGTSQGSSGGMGMQGGQQGMGMNGMQGMGGNGQFGQAQGATGMQVLQRGGEAGFVGATAQSIQNPFSTGVQARTTTNFNTLTQLMLRSRQNQFNRQQAQRNTRGNTQSKSAFRVPVRLGFQQPPGPPARVSGQLSSRLTKIPGLSQVGPIQVVMSGQTAVLRGTVASEADRQLAEGLARLEPEVQAVVNELQVANPETTAEAPAPNSAAQ
jgi:hypothetical protein